MDRHPPFSADELLELASPRVLAPASISDPVAHQVVDSAEFITRAAAGLRMLDGKASRKDIP